MLLLARVGHTPVPLALHQVRLLRRYHDALQMHHQLLLCLVPQWQCPIQLAYRTWALVHVLIYQQHSNHVSVKLYIGQSSRPVTLCNLPTVRSAVLCCGPLQEQMPLCTAHEPARTNQNSFLYSVYFTESLIDVLKESAVPHLRKS